MKRFFLVAILVVLNLGAEVSCRGQVPEAQKVGREAKRFSGRFALDDSIQLDMRLGTDGDDEVVRADSIRFERVADDMWAAVRVVERMAAEAKWRISVELLDSDDQRLGGAEAVFGTQEFMRLSQVSAEGELRLWLEPSEGLSNAAQFALTLEQAPDTASVTTALRRTGPIADRRGSLSLEVKVVDREGEPVEAAYVRVWRAIEGSDREWQGALIAYPNNPRAVGRVWHDPISERTWEPYCDNSYGQVDQAQRVFSKLRSGEYRVSAVRALHDANPDPTPVGVSEIVRVKSGGHRPSVSIRLEDGAALQVKLSEAATAEPLDGADVLLMRADGFPLGAECRSDPDGIVCYAHLAPGKYWLQATKTVRGHRPADYLTADRAPVQVEPGQKNQLELALRLVFLDQVEVWRRWPWCVTGQVTDSAGSPMAGVEIRANCGAGTLRTTDIIVTGPDGRYTLRPMPGMHYWDEQKEEWHAGVQAATIFAHKHGYYEADLCRQGGLLMADDPRDRGATRGPTTAGVLVPKEPYRLDFVMVPAAAVKGRLVDQAGQPVVGTYVSLKGDELPPSSSALASVKTDDEGRFTISSVPSKCYWFTLRHARHEWPTTEPIDFTKPGAYEVELIYDGSTDGVATLTCKLVTAP
jgi:protocatechuate 3,4-dioxygenase beta subunit